MGEHVIYVDEYGHPHEALITQRWDSGGTIENPSVNLVWVSSDESKTDQYGRQIERSTSVVHQSNQTAHGRYWKEVA